MSDKLPAIMFYTGDWLKDGVSRCSLEAQGLWLRMMILAHESKRYGYLEDSNGSPIPPENIARACGCTSMEQYETLLSELSRAGVPERTPNNVIYSRRMVRDAKIRSIRRRVGKLGGNPKLSGFSLVNQDVNQEDNQNPEDEVKTEKKQKQQQTLSLPENLKHQTFRDAWQRWVDYKRESKKKLKLSTAQAQIKNLAAMGLAKAIQSIDQSIANGWVGLFEPKPASGFRPQPSIFKPASDEVREQVEQRVQAELGPGDKPREIPRYQVPE